MFINCEVIDATEKKNQMKNTICMIYKALLSDLLHSFFIFLCREVVSYLLYKYGSTYQQFLRSESDRDFFLISQTYGPPGYQGGYSSPNDKQYNNNQYNGNDNYRNTNNNNVNQTFNINSGYPNTYYNANNRQQREQGGYGGGGSSSGGGGYQFAAAAAIPPMIQSMWWNHRDPVTSRPAYPYLQQHRGGYSRRKRQVTGDGQV